MPPGHLALRQLVAVVNTLPMDATFVDVDDRGAYLGTLETTEDVTEIRGLTGEKQLAD